jgi:hypothetical protein
MNSNPYYDLIISLLGNKIATKNNQTGIINSKFIKFYWEKLMSAPFPENDIEQIIEDLGTHNICVVEKVKDNSYNISLNIEDITRFNQKRNIFIDKFNIEYIPFIENYLINNSSIEFKYINIKWKYDRFHLQLNNTCIHEFENPNYSFYRYKLHKLYFNVQ